MLFSTFRPVFDTISTRNPPALTGAVTQTPDTRFSTASAPLTNAAQKASVTPTAVTAAAPQARAPKPSQRIAPKAVPASRSGVRPHIQPSHRLNPRQKSALAATLAAALTAALPAASLLPAASAAAAMHTSAPKTAAATPAGAHSPASISASPVLSTPELDALLSRCAPTVAPATMRAIVKTESSGNPFAIGVVGGRLSRQPRSLAEALATVRKLEARGLGYSAGLAQIYRKNFASLGLTPETAFSPCENLKAAARVLARCYEGATGTEAERLSAAFSCYYSGDPLRGRNLGYSARVAKNAGVSHPAFQPAFLPGASETLPWRPRAPPGEGLEPAAPSATGREGSKEPEGQAAPSGPGFTRNATAGLSPAL